MAAVLKARSRWCPEENRFIKQVWAVHDTLSPGGRSEAKRSDHNLLLLALIRRLFQVVDLCGDWYHLRTLCPPLSLSGALDGVGAFTSATLGRTRAINLSPDRCVDGRLSCCATVDMQYPGVQ